MRVLISCAVGYGNLNAVLPLARALTSSGHPVAVATGRQFCAWVEQLGLEAIPAGMDGPAVLEANLRRYPGWPGDVARSELLDFYLTRTCAEIMAPAKLDDLLAAMDAWAPDIVIHDPSDFAAPIAASRAGLPYVNHSWGPLFPTSSLERAGTVVSSLWRRCGVEPGPCAGVYRYLYLDIWPRSMQDQEIAGIETARAMRPVPVHLRLPRCVGLPDELPDWVSPAPVRPIVYLTLGTEFNRDIGLFSTFLDGVRGEPLNLVVSIGSANDPAAFGSQPSNVHIASYVNQPRVLPHCALMVCHGGPGSVLAALAMGVPLLALPQGMEQFQVARLCAAAGVGLQIGPAEYTADAVRQSVRSLLSEPAFAREARRVQAEIADVPGPEDVVELLEQVAAERRPVARSS